MQCKTVGNYEWAEAKVFVFKMPDNELVNILTLNEKLSDLWALCYTITSIFRIYFKQKEIFIAIWLLEPLCKKLHVF